MGITCLSHFLIKLKVIDQQNCIQLLKPGIHHIENKDYYYFDVNQEFKIGDKVRFFPVLNRANRFYGSPLACLVRKDEA